MKKNIYTILLLLWAFSVFGQSEGIDYQAVIYSENSYDAAGMPNILPDKEIVIRFTIKSSAKLIYQEEHRLRTDAFGGVKAIIGTGKLTKNSPDHKVRRLDHATGKPYTETDRAFTKIDWNGEVKMLRVEVSTIQPFTQFSLIDEQSLAYVHYAKHRHITVDDSVNVKKYTEFRDTLNVKYGTDTKLTGNLKVEGKSLLKDTVNAVGKSIFNSSVTVNYTPTSDAKIYPVEIKSKQHGINFTTTDEVNSDITYLTFSSRNSTVGAITGQSASDAYNDPTYIFTTVMQVVNTGFQIAKMVMAIVEPSPSDIAIEAVNTVILVQSIVMYQVYFNINHGIEYGSGSGDYAEWLPRENMDEQLRFGEVVGVCNGKISKNTENAQQVMVVSMSPIVVGNMPKDSATLITGNEVAFMGQVPVWVVGRVNEGDFLVCGQSGTGTAVAVSPENMTADLMHKIVGRALEANKFSEKKFVKTLVGVRTNDMYAVMKSQSLQIDKLSKQLSNQNQEFNQTEKILQNYLPEKNTSGKQNSEMR